MYVSIAVCSDKLFSFFSIIFEKKIYIMPMMSV